MFLEKRCVRWGLATVIAAACGVACADRPKCHTAGWPVADPSVRVEAAASLASGGAAVSAAGGLETRVVSRAWADDFPLNTFTAQGMFIIVR